MVTNNTLNIFTWANSFGIRRKIEVRFGNFLAQGLKRKAIEPVRGLEYHVGWLEHEGLAPGGQVLPTV